MKTVFAHELGRKIPDGGYCVETMVEMPMIDGEADYDNAKYKRVYVETHGEALQKAKEFLPGDFWGAVQISEYVLTPYKRGAPHCFIEYVGEPEYVERE